jgi:hypothetical protein
MTTGGDTMAKRSAREQAAARPIRCKGCGVDLVRRIDRKKQLCVDCRREIKKAGMRTPRARRRRGNKAA